MLNLVGTDKQIEYASKIANEVLVTYDAIESLLNSITMDANVKELFLSPVVESKELFAGLENAGKVIFLFKDIMYLTTTTEKVRFILAKINNKTFQPANGYSGTVAGNERTNALQDNVKEYFN